MMTLQDAYDAFVVFALARMSQHPLTEGDLETLRIAIKHVKDAKMQVVAGTFFAGARVRRDSPGTPETAGYDAAREADERGENVVPD